MKIENLTYNYTNMTRRSRTGNSDFKDMVSAAVTSQPELDQNPVEPSYHLTEEQISYLKSKYNVSDLSVDDFHKLMKELSDLGVVSESDGDIVPKTENGLSWVSRPIILGLFKRETHEKLFSYSGFEGGDILNWIEQYIEKNKTAVHWIQESNENLNHGLENLKNITSLEKHNHGANRIKDILNQLL